MKTFNKISCFAMLLAGSLALPSCKDNVLTPVNNTKSADSLVALISALNTKLVTVNAKDNTLQIQLAKFRSKGDSLNAISNFNGNYAQSVQYTVYVIDGGNTVTGAVGGGDRVACKDCKTAGVDGATVTVSSNGQTYTQVSADGRAVFNNLYVAGLATVTVNANGYTKCSYTTYFNPSGSSSGGGISSVSLYSSSFSGYSIVSTGVTPSSTNGSGSGAVFTITVGESGNITSIIVTSPGSGYKSGDLITFSGGNICDCSGSVTYQVSTSSSSGGGLSQTGTAINASTNVLILPTTGKNVTTFNGQLYINKSSMDDTLGRLYNKSTDAPRYLKFISPYGPYHGNNYTANYSQEYAQNQYYNINNESTPPGNAVSFTNLTTLAGLNYIYGYPTFVNNYYQPYSLNYQNLPGDIISISYSGLTAFAAISATGSYTLAVPSYENNPGTTVGTASGLWYGNDGNIIHYQDNYTYLSTTNYTGSTNVSLNVYDAATYAVTKITNYYQVTKMFEYYPFIENGCGGYSYIDGSDEDTQSFNTLPGQTVTRDIFFFATYLTGQ